MRLWSSYKSMVDQSTRKNFPDRTRIVFATNTSKKWVNHFCVIYIDTFLSDHLESFRRPGKLSDQTKSFPTIRKVFRPCVKFPDYPEKFQTIRKVPRPYGKFPKHLESFQIVWKMPRPSGKFPDQPESFQTIWKVSRPSGKFELTILWPHFRLSKIKTLDQV